MKSYMTDNLVSNFKRWWTAHDFTVLIGLYFFSLPIGKSSTLPLLAMSITGIVFFVRDLRCRKFPENSHLLLLVAACFFIPALFSLPDSIVISRTLEYLALYPLFVMVGYFILTRLKQGIKLLPLIHVMSLISVFWSACALWQFLLPQSSPFSPPVGGRYQGVFGQQDMNLGYALAPIIPFLVWGYWHHKRHFLSFLIGGFVILACLISGNRASWISVVAMLLALPIIALYLGYRPRLKSVASFCATCFILVIVGINLVSGTALGNRIDTTFSFFKEPSFQTFESSSAGRGEIWLTAVKIGMDNPWNGTGVRNFRYAHPYYAPENTSWRYPNSDQQSPHKYTGAMYPHQLVLQQFAGAGFLGLVGLVIFYLLLSYLSWQAVKSKNILAIGASLAVWMGFFPFNTHLNFHGSWLTANFWVWCGMLFGVFTRIKERA